MALFLRFLVLEHQKGTGRAAMSDQGQEKCGRARGANAVVPVSANDRDWTSGERWPRRAGSRPAAAFLAQLFGARAMRRRLELAREDAPKVLEAYRSRRPAHRNGSEVDFSV